MSQALAANGAVPLNWSNYNATLHCAPRWSNESGAMALLPPYELFDPWRCLTSMGVNASSIAQRGTAALLSVNTTVWPSRDWVWTQLRVRVHLIGHL